MGLLGCNLSVNREVEFANLEEKCKKVFTILFYKGKFEFFFYDS